MRRPILTLLAPLLLILAPACNGGTNPTTSDPGTDSDSETETSGTETSDPTTSGSDSDSDPTINTSTQGPGTDTDPSTTDPTTDSSTETEGTDTGPVSCAELDEQTCIDTAGCMPINATPIPELGEGKYCYGETEFVGCVEEMACGDAISYYCDANADPNLVYEFLDTCAPPDWIPCEPPMDIEPVCE